MADINNPEALKFSNRSIRVGCDKLTQAYDVCDDTLRRWNALDGTVQEKYLEMSPDVIKAADFLWAAHQFTLYRESLWLNGISAILPDTADQVADGSPNAGRPGPNTGNKSNAAVFRMRQYNNWIRTNDFDAFDMPGNSANIDKIMVMTSEGLITRSDAQIQNLIDLCTALTARYEANANTDLNALLALATNPTA